MTPVPTDHRVIAITGSEGYLARLLIRRLKDNPKIKIYGLDIRPTSDQVDEKYEYIQQDITDPDGVHEVLRDKNIDTVIHTTWWFNPTHDVKAQRKLDIEGTKNIFRAMVANKIPNLVYLGSTTAYGALETNPSEEPFLREEDWEDNKWERLNEKYLYGKHKAFIDEEMQYYVRHYTGHNIFWIRGAIVLGPNTNNIVSYIAKSPFTFGKFMFRVAGYDPPMQYVSEYDIIEVLYTACMQQWQGVVNVAGKGTIKYSDMIRVVGRKEICLPSWILYPVVEILWRLRVFKFPSSLLRLIQNPWIANVEKLEKHYGYKVRDTSEDALIQFAQAMK